MNARRERAEDVAEPRRSGGSVAAPAIDLLWIPLGAGGHFVRLNGRVYERARALAERRAPLELLHTALEIHLADGRFAIENAWPVAEDPGSRGVVAQGPVFSARFARFRTFRYEIRRMREGRIPDARWAIATDRVSRDEAQARRVLALVPSVPKRVWGRRDPQTGEMWNSNSVIAWLLARAGLDMAVIKPPRGWSAPGWATGVVAARVQE